MAKQITDMETWLLDNDNRIFRYRVYRRLFTPFEQQIAFSDESCFESAGYLFGIIQEAVELSNGDWFIGIQEIIGDELQESISYYRLSEIRLEFYSEDQMEELV